MNGTDYTVRATAATLTGHSRFTVVDRHGRVAHVTVHRQAAIDGHADRIIRARVAALGPHRLVTR